MKDFQIQAIGLMSGTSLDGLDVCCCTFRQQAGKWSFHIDCAKGYSYPDAMKQILGTGAQTMSALEFITFHSFSVNVSTSSCKNLESTPILSPPTGIPSSMSLKRESCTK